MIVGIESVLRPLNTPKPAEPGSGTDPNDRVATTRGQGTGIRGIAGPGAATGHRFRAGNDYIGRWDEVLGESVADRPRLGARPSPS